MNGSDPPEKIVKRVSLLILTLFPLAVLVLTAISVVQFVLLDRRAKLLHESIRQTEAMRAQRDFFVAYPTNQTLLGLSLAMPLLRELGASNVSTLISLELGGQTFLGELQSNRLSFYEVEMKLKPRERASDSRL